MDNPTELLCTKLDELGVEYVDSTLGTIFWGKSEYEQYCDGHTRLIVIDATPEQAIAATVGAGTCKRVYHPNRLARNCTCSNCGYGASDERWAYCPKCGHKYVHGEVEERWKKAGRKVAE